MSNCIAKIRKNAVERLHVELDQFKGRDLLGLRIYVDNDDGEEIPTRKGVTVRVDLLPELRAALEQAETAAIEAGLLKANA